MARKCDVNGCENDGAFALFAAYALDETAVHPTLARYPFPMMTPCAEHLPAAMQADQKAHGATPYYVVRTLP